ncbi:MTH1187 family thiamine-binding protein [Bacillus rubiinfantis]|uniref:MTH1187 family thiamine-binding protein n=1 Tax=Bacillus rubiinfantis TaxID=1499680 RepID=UPI0005A9A546|nr:MTH1187 family thiamine-binding protein [Bacillus rubiinfantis]
MAIVDITVIPVGTATASVSDYVADIHKFLQHYKGNVKYELTAMSTLIEGDLSELLAIVQQLHELPFQTGAQRVCTNIRIDERRDKEHSMKQKLQSVQNKL